VLLGKRLRPLAELEGSLTFGSDSEGGCQPLTLTQTLRFCLSDSLSGSLLKGRGQVQVPTGAKDPSPVQTPKS
jgi:hypothetical protein